MGARDGELLLVARAGNGKGQKERTVVNFRWYDIHCIALQHEDQYIN
jgi:hypothetical protein